MVQCPRKRLAEVKKELATLSRGADIRNRERVMEIARERRELEVERKELEEEIRNLKATTFWRKSE
jgi:hypothetical protein